MTSVKKLLLLLAAVGVSAAAPEDCETLNKTLPHTELHKVFGDWVLVWSVSDSKSEESANLLANLSSSAVTLQHLADNTTVRITERNLFQDKTWTRYVIDVSPTSDPADPEPDALSFNGYSVEKNDVVSELNETGRVFFYEVSPDGLVLVYNGSWGRFLLVYKREGQHQDVEQFKADHSSYMKRAECFGVKADLKYVYDGASDLLPKKPAPAAPQQA